MFMIRLKALGCCWRTEDWALPRQISREMLLLPQLLLIMMSSLPYSCRYARARTRTYTKGNGDTNPQFTVGSSYPLAPKVSVV